MNRGKPPPQYDAEEEAHFRALLVCEDARNMKKNQNVDLRSAKLILTAPNGARFQVVVSNSGVLTAMPL